MPIIYRHEKGMPLTTLDMDGNFSELDQRIQQLEEKPILAEGIRSIIQEGDQIVIIGTFGTTWGHLCCQNVCRVHVETGKKIRLMQLEIG